MKRVIAKDEPKTKEDVIIAITRVWKENLTDELCGRYIHHDYKVTSIEVAMNGKATCDVPNRMFPELSE
ncbi:hypothetical protein DPMN_057340 [Dreissena polymorpha]|uniref:Uncharacterized protein n=1 Tax=Dreissena polymorpha TaxID=45954 RepID=A0A9D4HEN5_DREPO|nr:hypothetical protein DPMN_057340 [Dreissena polymorpha]